MPPLLKADPKTSAAMRDIRRTAWEAQTGITATAGEHKRTNGFPNKNPGRNKNVELLEFTPPGQSEADTKWYIADAWPNSTENGDSVRRENRIEQGQGPRGSDIFVPVGEDGLQFVRMTTLSPTRKHWTRGQRRLKQRIARLSRKTNEASKRKRLRRPALRIWAGKGPTPRNPANKKPEEAAAE